MFTVDAGALALKRRDLQTLPGGYIDELRPIGFTFQRLSSTFAIPVVVDLDRLVQAVQDGALEDALSPLADDFAIAGIHSFVFGGVVFCASQSGPVNLLGATVRSGSNIGVTRIVDADLMSGAIEESNS
jgi:hypothetical protein